MENKLFRETIVIKYVETRKLEKKTEDVWSIDEYIRFYEENKKSLNSSKILSSSSPKYFA